MTLLTTAEVARKLKVSRAWVSQHACGRRRPVLPSIKISEKLRRFDEAVIEAWLKKLGVEA